ncbi:Protein IQ-domain 31 [Apostasia shenzhenica]|uniref:Protein IQ-domain 31 n=1 Tax=Apostasia shenzhenica TaxID=1088818 RepID=A0A2I0B6K8_9ASPA|nr:Protein IQ-domain 31 [Apostasia shenzhenica]
MGRAASWLKSMLGWKKERREYKDRSAASSAASESFGDRREKRRWSFKSVRDSPYVAGSAPSWQPNEQSKHAMAVAAFTAAAADAAVAAAQAAVAAVRLTSRSRSSMITAFRERLAAAKKALRALKALVKLQALVRGHLVRKQAAAIFYSMQALARARATARAQKCRALLTGDPRKSPGRVYDARFGNRALFHNQRLSGSSNRSPKIMEMESFRPKSRSFRRANFSSRENSDEILPCFCPGRISIPDHEWSFSGYKCLQFSTAHSTPRRLSSGGGGNIAPPTPAKSVYGVADGVLFRPFMNSSDCPSYMGKTQSFEAKMRSQSAPKQRPEPRSGKRTPLREVVIKQSRANLSGDGTQKTEQEFNFKGSVLKRDFDSLRKW